MRTVKSGFEHAFKSMTGIDIEELTAFGDQVGRLLVEFRDTLIRIEERLGLIESHLRLDNRGGRVIKTVDPPGRPLS